MKAFRQFIDEWVLGFGKFVKLFLGYFINTYIGRWFGGFENVKDLAVVRMYKQRGKYANLFVHAGLFIVMILGIVFGPTLLVDSSSSVAELSTVIGGRVFGASEEDVTPLTQVSDKPRSENESYPVQEGDTFKSIADKYGVSVESVKWANPDIDEKKVKAGSKIIVPPVTGVVQVVKAGETVYSVAKKYNVDAQSIVDFPFNTFTNDETFSLAIGQELVVPDGVMPKDEAPAPSRLYQTPNAGSVTATGNWVWPAAGKLTQPFRSWHKGLDIANHNGGPILAADAGSVAVTGWDKSGYGNKVVINHGNGYLTLYAHMSRIDVVVGQTVKRGDRIGMMGSTGRSTGTHLHFEIRTTKGNLDPMGQLK
jgi:murein DD-endopeptidase MepM/ murein hydrolase activator NlpD